jgi:hypothetical protein
MSQAALRVLNSGLPRAPWDIAEEVELFARESGRTATLHYIPGSGWFARFSLRTNDPRMRLYQEGHAEAPPTEDVWFHRPKPGGRPGDFIMLDIEQMGRSGVRTFLERGNTWSGRGEFDSVEDAARKAMEANRREREKLRADARENNRYAQREKRRWRFKIPFLRGGLSQ